MSRRACMPFLRVLDVQVPLSRYSGAVVNRVVRSNYWTGIAF